jgi:putative phosphoribosyl transferase
MPFQNREEAARLLAGKLAKYKGRNPLVLGIPRGAVPMAKIIADALDGELDVVLVHKLGAPDQPELAIGSVDENGHLYLGEVACELGIGADYIEEEKETQLNTLRDRRARYTPLRAPIDPSGRIVIVVDNGIATGSTMIAALRAIRTRQPKRLIAAIAVAPARVFKRIAKESEEIVCLETPENFFAVGEFFRDFSQVSDEEVAAILQERVTKRAVG